MSTENRPLILVTNDDGLLEPGIEVLAEALVSLGDVYVIAPHENQSGVSHKLSLHDIVRVTRHSEKRIAVHGTPVDCVYLAVNALLPRAPDLIVSGINTGPNLGTDVHYSGTVGAAVEGTLFGISSIAVSCVSRKEANFEHAANFIAGLAGKVLADGGLPTGTTLNVNVPKGAPDTFQRTFLGHRPYKHSVEQRNDPRGGRYYWIGGDPLPFNNEEPGSDGDAVRQGRISVTPLMLDVTDYKLVRDVPLAVQDFEESPFIEPPEGHKLGTWC